MRIEFIDIQNFRKLKYVRVEFSQKETVFVGANNSGKTSAMDALMVFLRREDKIMTTSDFTLSNWKDIDQIATGWIENSNPDELDLCLDPWRPLVPTLDVWIHVEDNEFHRVSHIIPTLDWSGGKLGVRLAFEPKNVEELYNAYREAYINAKEISESHTNVTMKLWPQSMSNFLEEELKQFSMKAYILDPSKLEQEPQPQKLPENSDPLEGDPFKGLFKVDIINAQRGFSDPKSIEKNPYSDRRLSTQLIKYFEKHLDPKVRPEKSDLDALEAIEAAQNAFDNRLKQSFKSSIKELEELNYPGFSDPRIRISSILNQQDGLKHEAAVKFDVLRDDSASDDLHLSLPEKYNGLGYQNLISMIFNLIRFRDEWMREGKAKIQKEINDDALEPLHIVLIEEPEAHLHAQVQQVFIKKAYCVLRNHSSLGDSTQHSTQLVISTHSSHIAHEIDFGSLRYFKRKPADNSNIVPSAEVVNLSTTFGDDSATTKFASRYLKTTHCDLFFADAAILIEGQAERMLMPHFIRKGFPGLDRSYISLLEIGGSHAHRLKPLIETLGLLTLVVTDLDAINKDSSKKVLPEKNKGYRTGNATLKNWIPKKNELDELLTISEKGKTKAEYIRVAYQTEIQINHSQSKEVVIPYTFEDALVFSNFDFFRTITKSTGLLKKMADASNIQPISEACNKMFDALDKNSKKAEMALECKRPTYLTR